MSSLKDVGVIKNTSLRIKPELNLSSPLLVSWLWQFYFRKPQYSHPWHRDTTTYLWLKNWTWWCLAPNIANTQVVTIILSRRYSCSSDTGFSLYLSETTQIKIFTIVMHCIITWKNFNSNLPNIIWRIEHPFWWWHIRESKHLPLNSWFCHWLVMWLFKNSINISFLFGKMKDASFYPIGVLL